MCVSHLQGIILVRSEKKPNEHVYSFSSAPSSSSSSSSSSSCPSGREKMLTASSHPCSLNVEPKSSSPSSSVDWSQPRNDGKDFSSSSSSASGFFVKVSGVTVMCTLSSSSTLISLTTVVSLK